MNGSRFSIAAEATTTFSLGAAVSKADPKSVVGQKKVSELLSTTFRLGAELLSKVFSPVVVIKE